MAEFPRSYTKNIRILDLTNLADVFADVERKYNDNLIAGRPTGPHYANLKSFLFDRERPFPACCPNAEELRIGSDIVDGQTSMITCLRYLRKLRTLDVRCASVGLGSFSGITARSNCPRLTELKIECSETLEQENVHIANFLKSLQQCSLTNVSISGLTQRAGLRKVMEGLNVHCGSLKSLRLVGFSKLILALLPAVGFLPYLENLEIITTSRTPLSAKSKEEFANWLMFLPSLTSITIKGHDADYLIHKSLARPFNCIKKVDITTTRREDVPMHQYDLFFRSLAACEVIIDLSLRDDYFQWCEGAIVRCCSSLKHLSTLRTMNLHIHGMTEMDLIDILHSLPDVEEVSVSLGISDRTLRRLARNTVVRNLVSSRYPSCVSVHELVKLFEIRDRDDAIPIVISMEGGSRLLHAQHELLRSARESWGSEMKHVYSMDGPSSAGIMEYSNIACTCLSTAKLTEVLAETNIPSLRKYSASSDLSSLPESSDGDSEEGSQFAPPRLLYRGSPLPANDDENGVFAEDQDSEDESEKADPDFDFDMII
ncbi:hypothetical protein POJ06DRAFT_117871 [Lipomyces tetrasporus]|uniref:RNI-like protein n=1 Tax=Lipomyces tetrasporus TaxID=54092 RepID=A0AAD7QR06_9ASCO|nr:uncharacterized protein POJ06DRAFT_117871 [Lipomyces tetrasporus]KAJ8099839.1 hypothetical protein POJ06DRAFT_117871 [Lipomyces tetrasporus]